MLINDRRNVRKLAQVTGTKFAWLFAVSGVVAYAADGLGWRDMLFPAGLVGILVAAVSIFLAFRINAGYARWWHARQSWGGIVNECRSLGLYVGVLLRAGDTDAAAAQAWRRRVVLRQIAYVHALRLQLRGHPPADWERDLWGRRIDGTPLLDDAEAARLRGAGNVAAQILAQQGRDIADFLHAADGDPSWNRQVAIGELLRALYARQGDAESIKTTVLAWGYVAYTRLLARALAVIVICSHLNSFTLAGAGLVAFIAAVFLTVEQVGRNLDNPFEGRFNDTPLSSLCRTVEIDLLQQIGEPCDLQPLAPADGRLD
jgi:putative membrane protein